MRGEQGGQVEADSASPVGLEEHDLPDSSQYGDSSHPERRMRAVQWASDLVVSRSPVTESNR